MALGAAVPATSAHPQFADSPPLLSLAFGAVQIFDNHQELFWGVEYRPAFQIFHVGPWFLFGTGKNDEFYAAIGALMNVELGRGWTFTPSFGAGYYNASSGLDLGFDAEFRSAVELTRCFGNGQRIGLCFAHLSNGSLSDKNPGTESIGLNYAFPLNRIFRCPPPDPPPPAK